MCGAGQYFTILWSIILFSHIRIIEDFLLWPDFLEKPGGGWSVWNNTDLTLCSASVLVGLYHKYVSLVKLLPHWFIDSYQQRCYLTEFIRSGGFQGQNEMLILAMVCSLHNLQSFLLLRYNWSTKTICIINVCNLVKYPAILVHFLLYHLS